MRNFAQPLGSDAEIFAALRELLPTGFVSDPSLIDESLRRLEGKFGAAVYSLFLQRAFHVDRAPLEAKNDWALLLAHHQGFRLRTGADIDFRVSALDYFSRVVRLISNPTIVETDQFLSIYRNTVTDAMTGLFNFRFFEDSLEREFSRAERYRSPFSLLFFDVDHFKIFNDRCGHQAGDKILREVARVILKSVRGSDFPCRYGGEEFAVIAPQTSREGALLVAERIRRGVEAIEIPEVREMGKHLTISGGISCFPEDAKRAKELIECADRALYLAKESGRNRITPHKSKDERRRSPRFPAELSAAYALLPEQKAPVATMNISEGGFLLQSESPLPPGGVINFEVSLSDPHHPIRCIGRVMHLNRVSIENRFHVGISIIRMSMMDTHRFRTFVSSRLAA